MVKHISIVLLILVTGATPSQETTHTVSELFQKAPVSVFDYTTEGISSKEKNDLVSKGESQHWKITSKSDKILEIQSKNPSSQLFFFLLRRPDSLPCMMSYTQNEDNSKIETWGLNKEGIVERENLMPTITAKEFISENTIVKNISDYNNNIQYRFDTNTHLIHVEFFTWMEGSLENFKTDYDITLKWTGNGFETQKIKRDKK